MDVHPAVFERAKRSRSSLLSAAAMLAVAGSVAAAASGATTGSPLNLQGKNVLTGKPVSLAADAGKPVVVNLWSSSCGACFADAHALATFEHAHPTARVVGVDVADSAAGARSLSKRAGWRHPSIADPSGRIAARLRMESLPTTLFLNAKHEIVERINGQTTAAGFASGYRKALG